MGLVQHDCKTNGGGGGYGRGGSRGGCGGGVVVQRKDKRGASGFIIVVFNGNGVVWEGSQMNGWRFGDGTVEKEEKEKKKDHVMGWNNSGSLFFVFQVFDFFCWHFASNKKGLKYRLKYPGTGIILHASIFSEPIYHGTRSKGIIR